MAEPQNETYYIHYPEYLAIAYKAANQTAEILSVEPLAMPSDALVAIIFSALAVEAFTNEITEMAGLTIRSRSGASIDRLRDLRSTLTEVDDERGSVQLKYQMMSKILSGRTFDQGAQPFQDFQSLIRLRNDLAHLRNRNKTDVDGHVSPTSSAVRQLQQLGLTRTSARKPGDVPGGTSWLNQLETAGAAAWAYSSALNIITAIGDMLPEDIHASAIGMVKQGIRNQPRLP